MFNKTAAQLVSTRSMAKSALKATDENKTTFAVAASSKNVGRNDSKVVATRKRRALGDVSNSISTAVATSGKSGASKVKSAASTAVSKKVSTTGTVKKADDKKTVVKKSMLAQEDVHKRQKVVAATQLWQDLDAPDFEDPVMVSEYVVEIFEYLRELEDVMPEANYMLLQKELQWKMRAILIDWLVEVHQKFKLLQETLFLAVNIIDRFLSVRAVALGKLQLVGITSLFIAAKYEEVFAPSINQFVYITDGGYTNEELIKAERFILATLNFNLQYPNPLNFLRRISKADNYDITTRTAGKYLMEITLLDEAFLTHPPSMIAAAAMYISRHVYANYEWDETIAHYAGYKESELETCVTKMIAFLHRETLYDSVFQKYSSDKNYNAAMAVEKWMEECVAERDFSMPWL